MDSQAKAGWQIPLKSETCKLIRWLKYMLHQSLNLIMSCREAQARRRIQLYFDDCWIDELAEEGKRIAKKEVKY